MDKPPFPTPTRVDGDGGRIAGSDRAPTLADVARLAGVSRSLVSLALRGDGPVSPAARERITQAAARLNYRPNIAARTLASTRARHIGVIVGDVTNPLFAEIAKHVTIAADEAGLSTVVSLDSATDERAIRAVDTLLMHSISGLIMIGAPYEKPAIAAVAGRLPSVYIGRLLLAVAVDSVTTDHVAGMGLATRHLIDAGHRRIVHLGGGRSAGASRMEQGYRATMDEAGLTPWSGVIDGDMTMDAGARAAERMLAGGRPLPDAVAACCDMAALGFLSVMQRAGVRVPADIAVSGYDDIPLAQADCVSLSTVRQCPADLAALGVRTLGTRLAAPDRTPIKATVAPRLIVRQSTTGA